MGHSGRTQTPKSASWQGVDDRAPFILVLAPPPPQGPFAHRVRHRCGARCGSLVHSEFEPERHKQAERHLQRTNLQWCMVEACNQTEAHAPLYAPDLELQKMDRTLQSHTPALSP